MFIASETSSLPIKSPENVTKPTGENASALIAGIWALADAEKKGR